MNAAKSKHKVRCYPGDRQNPPYYYTDVYAACPDNHSITGGWCVITLKEYLDGTNLGSFLFSGTKEECVYWITLNP